MIIVIEALNGPLAGEIFPVGRRCIIGRDADADVQLVQKGVSRQHAAVLIDDNDNIFLMDLASKNGTFFNDQSIGRVPLSVGETFVISDTKFQLKEADSSELSDSQREGHELHLASGPATDMTVEATQLSEKEMDYLRSLKDK
ncbi:MAG: FHA domain-containing protein [Polyangiaceae bacterium]|nr:FHA domain-containing protein [Polyangiaceae bacterium]